MIKIYSQIYNYFRPKFNQKMVWDKIAFQYFKNCQNILDAGCGEGRFIFQDRKKIVGLDWNENSIKECKESDLNVVRGDVRSIPFADESFDGVHSSHVIEHFLPGDVYKILFEFNRVLKRGGVLIIRSPLMWKGFYSDLTHIKPYNPESIIHYLTPSKQRTLRHVSKDFKVVKLKFRYEPLKIGIEFIDVFFRILNRSGFPWLKKNGYMLILRKNL